MPNPSKNTLLISGIIVPVVAAVLTATLTDIGEEIMDHLFPTKVFFEGSVLEAGNPVSGIHVFLNENEQTDVTDNRGIFVFEEVREGRHTCHFEHKGESYRYRITIDGSTDETVSDQFDIGAKEVESPERDTEEDLESTPPVTTTPVVSETETATEGRIAASLRVPTQVSAERVSVQNLLIQQVSPNELLAKLSLHVRENKQDKNRTGDMHAFNYHLQGEEKYLDQIDAVYYVRNHKSFSEYANNRYLSAHDRSTNFNYKGYQWGYIKTVNVKLLLKNGKESDWALKEIIYD